MHSGNPAEQLVKMANNIAAFFVAEPDHQEAIAGMTDHIRKFWEPRMLEQMADYLNQHQGEGLSPLALEAFKQIQG